MAGLLALDDEEISETIDAYQRGFTFLRDPRFVSIAAVQGHAIGAGFQLALSCDLRVVADDAQFCMKESALGLVPDLTGTKPLVESVGYARALEICATARMVGADEAVAIGLALTAVPADRPRRDGRGPRGALTAAAAGRGHRDQDAAPGSGRARPRGAAAPGARGAGAPLPRARAGAERPQPADGVGAAACRGCTVHGVRAWRHLRSDRTRRQQPHRPATRSAGSSGSRARTARLISVFLVLTVVDAGLVVVTPLLVQRIVDDGIPNGDDRPGHLAGAGDGRRRRASARCSTVGAAGSPPGSARA